jgi:hypothetical protein
MRGLVVLAFASLAAPALAAGPISPLPSCLTPFLHADKHGKMLFSFQPRVDAPGSMPSSIADGPPTGLVCSPGGRIIDAGTIEETFAYGANEIDIIDGRMNEFVFSSLALDFTLSPDRRFIVFRPWGGPVGNGSILAEQTLYLVDVDHLLKPASDETLSAVGVYPTDTDDFHPPAKGENESVENDKWFAWFETLPHPDGIITWTGPRQFTFSLAGDGEDDVHTPWSGKSFQVTATIVLRGSDAPRVVLSIAGSPSCPNGVATIHAVVDAVKACSK